MEIGIIGVTDKVPDTSKTILADNYIEAGQHYIQEIKNKFTNSSPQATGHRLAQPTRNF